MSRVEEIERVIEELSPDDFAHVVKRVYELQQARWDEQLDSDSAARKLDFLFAEAKADLNDDLLMDWPPKT